MNTPLSTVTSLADANCIHPRFTPVPKLLTLNRLRELRENLQIPLNKD